MQNFETQQSIDSHSSQDRDARIAKEQRRFLINYVLFALFNAIWMTFQLMQGYDITNISFEDNYLDDIDFALPILLASILFFASMMRSYYRVNPRKRV